MDLPGLVSAFCCGRVNLAVKGKTGFIAWGVCGIKRICQANTVFFGVVRQTRDAGEFVRPASDAERCYSS